MVASCDWLGGIDGNREKLCCVFPRNAKSRSAGSLLPPLRVTQTSFSRPDRHASYRQKLHLPGTNKNRSRPRTSVCLPNHTRPVADTACCSKSPRSAAITIPSPRRSGAPSRPHQAAHPTPRRPRLFRCFCVQIRLVVCVVLCHT